MKVLVITSETVSADQLRNVLPDGIDPQDTEVMVVAPALQDSPMKFWFSDADEAIAKAEQVRQSTVEQLGDSGVPASGDTGESDPLKAIEDALTTFPADRIVLFTHSGSGQRYREDALDAEQVRDRFGLPVDHATISSSPA